MLDYHTPACHAHIVERRPYALARLHDANGLRYFVVGGPYGHHHNIHGGHATRYSLRSAYRLLAAVRAREVAV